ncbi:hypothetical protein GOP47_0009880 [Adiantum capillus-veneris]|uniref:Uncharacterized protein n=1 Tax=Adiantum capillus-veneris TaxID=13818 RepID=A0A9D4ZHM7_ADICA|nr:hypothetical protein GOP47_0009880 [Adiantum capillus-veneris]
MATSTQCTWLLSLSPLIALLALPPTLALLPDELTSEPDCRSFPNISSFPPGAEIDPRGSTYPMFADHDGMSLTLFPQLVFHLSSGCSRNSSFTLTSDGHSQAQAPSLAFFILVSSIPTSASPASSLPSMISYVMELCFTCVEDKSGPPDHEYVCNDVHAINEHSASASTSKEEEAEQASLFRDELSLKYNASTGALHALVAQYQHGAKITISFNLNITNNPSMSTTLFLGYITANDSHRTITINNDAPPQEGMERAPNVEKSHHRVTKLVWIIVGTLLGASLIVMGVTILVLFIKKRNHDPILPKGISSVPRRKVTTTHARPLGHDLEASEVPMMRSPPPTPPHYNAFQVSGIATWLKQPTPR